MPMMKFNPDRKRNEKSKRNNKRNTKPIKETPYSKPTQKYDSSKNNSKQSKPKKSNTNKKIGRPRKNKHYATLRTEVNNVLVLNALQNALGYDTQDSTMNALLNKARSNLDNNHLKMFDLFYETYKNRYNRKHNK